MGATYNTYFNNVEQGPNSVANPVLNDLTRDWRQVLDGPARVELAGALWQTDIYEARIAAAKLLTTARIRPGHRRCCSACQATRCRPS